MGRSGYNTKPKKRKLERKTEGESVLERLTNLKQVNEQRRLQMA